jgi:hypothetical protein
MSDDSLPDEFGPLDAAPEAPLKLQAFAPSELITCNACRRTNAPNRSACLYCGANLANVAAAPAIAAAATTPAGAAADSGVTLATSDAKELSGDQINRLSSLIHVEASLLRPCLAAGGPLPLVRAGTLEEAARLSADMLAAGLQIITVSDEELGANGPFRKIRGLEFIDDSMTALPKIETDQPVLPADVLLLVAGRVVTNRVEVEEKRHRKGAKPIDSRQFIADESVMDIYTRTNPAAWRVYANNFDFSCLGPDKRMTGFENFAALINMIRDRMPNVVIDDSYHRKRAVLGSVWRIETVDTSELRVAGRGKLNLSNITTSDNESQFNKYSALAWHLRAKAEVATE